jgi:hypothetical protein
MLPGEVGLDRAVVRLRDKGGREYLDAELRMPGGRLYPHRQAAAPGDCTFGGNDKRAGPCRLIDVRQNAGLSGFTRSAQGRWLKGGRRTFSGCYSPRVRQFRLPRIDAGVRLHHRPSDGPG